MNFFTHFRRLWCTIFVLFFSISMALATITIGTVTPPSPGSCNGSIEVIANGTAGPFRIDITGPGDFSDFVEGINGNHTFTGLCGGEYTIAVTNAYMCITVMSTTMDCPLNFSSDVSTTCAPSINITPADGVAPYTFQWEDSNGQAFSTEATVQNLQPGQYCVTVTDANSDLICFRTSR